MKRSTHTLAQKSQLLIMEALFIFIQKKSFDDITISELCKKADVSRRTFYRNFKDKNDVLEFYFLKLQNEYITLLQDMNANNFFTYALCYFDFWSHHLEFLKAAKKDKTLFAMLIEMLNVFIPSMYYPNLNPSHENTRYDIYFIIGGFHNVLIQWIQNDCQETPKNIAKNISIMLDSSISFLPSNCKSKNSEQ